MFRKVYLVNKANDMHLMGDLNQILRTGNFTTQEAICDELLLRGHEVNQSKISRLLRKIGAIKTKNEAGEVSYLLPLEPTPPTLSSRLNTLIIDVQHNEHTIIINTSPGAAMMIARVLDLQRQSLNILGVIAGDDTILVIPKSINKLSTIVDKIKQQIAHHY